MNTWLDVGNYKQLSFASPNKGPNSLKRRFLVPNLDYIAKQFKLDSKKKKAQNQKT